MQFYPGGTVTFYARNLADPLAPHSLSPGELKELLSGYHVAFIAAAVMLGASGLILAVGGQRNLGDSRVLAGE